MNKKVLRQVIKPSYKDNQLSPFPVDFDPDVVGYILDEGSRGNIELQDDLFNTMEDTWDRLRTNLNKLKQNVIKMPREIEPSVSRGGSVNNDAAEKAAFIEGLFGSQSHSPSTNKLDLDETFFALLDAVARGISVLEVNWVLKDGYYLPDSTTKVPASCLGFEQASAYNGDDVDPEKLMLYPDRDKSNPVDFSKYPDKFLVGIYRGKSGHPAEAANLRCLAHHWTGRMLGWEWLAQKTELFGIPIRWATYNPSAPDSEINEIKNMLENMGTAAWGAFPNGTDLDVIQGSTPGVAGGSEPTERIMFLADRAADLLFLGQNLTSESGSSGSYALGAVHRQVELDLYQAYANFVTDSINHTLIPSIIKLNWGNYDNLPILRLQLDRSAESKEKIDRDKKLFLDMGLPVAKHWLYTRHGVPEPADTDILFTPPVDESESVASAPVPYSQNPMPGTNAPVTGKKTCSCCVDGKGMGANGASESNEEFFARKAAGAVAFGKLIEETDLQKNDIIWSGGDCSICEEFNETAFGTGWTSPPPLHHNCDCVLTVTPKL